MKPKKVKIGDLVLDPANARKHSPRNIKAIAASLQRFGQQKPIVVDKSNVVRAGNGQLQAAIELGWDEIEVVVTSLTGAEAAAYAIADNRTAELAEWDDPVLKATLEALADEDRALLDACGYTEEELDALVTGEEVADGDGTTGEITEDEVPEPPAEPITKPGDLWLLGVYYECESCGKKYEYAAGLKMNGECPCG
jgi:ParB-like chromosome segregation protein Spo0J